MLVVTPGDATHPMIAVGSGCGSGGPSHIRASI